MKKERVIVICLALVMSSMVFPGAVAVEDTPSGSTLLKATPADESNQPLGDPVFNIVSPEPGFLYLLQLNPIPMPISQMLNLGHAVVIGRDLVVDTHSENIDHVEFVATGKLTGWQTTRWDYQYINGLSVDMNLNSGFYDIQATAYDGEGEVLGSDSVNVFYIKLGSDDFGLSINTCYDNGETFSSPLNIGIAEFGSMLTTGESKFFPVTLQSEDDTLVEVRFSRTSIMGGSENVVETKFNVETDCDTSKEYEVSLDVRFPFTILNGGQPGEENNPYFEAKVGYQSFTDAGEGANKVDTTFYFGRETLDDPRIFRLKLNPNSLEDNSKISYYTSYLAVDDQGNEVFNRVFSTDFEPATELTITTTPLEGKVQYDFGESAGVPTKISFRAEGGLFDDIIQSYKIDPLPSYMAFDLTFIGAREFIYESDSTYDVTYSLDSLQNGNLVTFEVDSVPESIHASWGIDLGEFGDLSASSFAELDMSQDVDRMALYLMGEEVPFFSLENFPRNIRYESLVDILDGTGDISFYRGIDEDRELTVALAFDELVVAKTFELKNTFVQLAWDIDLGSGQGMIEVNRDAQSDMTFSTSIQYSDWIFTKSVQLRNSHVHLAWDIDREERQGSIEFLRDDVGGDPEITFSIEHDGWVIADTLELKNELVEFYWDLATDTDPHAELGVNKGGDDQDLFYNSLSVYDDGVELLRLGMGLETEDNFKLSWDNEGGQISNFEWTGRVRQLSNLDVAVHLPGDVLEIQGSWTVSESGEFSIGFNQPVDVTFVDWETDRYKIYGHISFDAGSELSTAWDLQDQGFFSIHTNDEPLGQDASFMFLWDPQNTGNYKYGIDLSAPEFMETAMMVSWDRDYLIPRIWISGDPPFNWHLWDKWLLWDYEWYDIGD